MRERRGRKEGKDGRRESALIRSEISDWQKIALLYRSTERGRNLAGRQREIGGEIDVAHVGKKKDNADESNINNDFKISYLLHIGNRCEISCQHSGICENSNAVCM